MDLSVQDLSTTPQQRLWSAFREFVAGSTQPVSNILAVIDATLADPQGTRKPLNTTRDLLRLSDEEAEAAILFLARKT